jgi:hypothetical protein
MWTLFGDATDSLIYTCVFIRTFLHCKQYSLFLASLWEFTTWFATLLPLTLTLSANFSKISAEPTESKRPLSSSCVVSMPRPLPKPTPITTVFRSDVLP